MTTIYRENADRLSVADAKRLILDAVPVEKAVDIYAQVDDQGNINWDGNIECRVNEKANIPASHLDNDFLATCNALSIRPRMKYRPVITDYAGNVSQDGFYTIAHDEFVRLAELFGLLVVTGKAPEPQATTPSPAPVVAAGVFGGVETGKAGPVEKGWVMKKAALMDKHADKWKTIKSDFHSASENGLSKAAKAPGHGEWFEAAALNWARQRGKLEKEKEQGPANLATVWASKKHTIEG